MDRESLTLPVANSQFYTNAVSSITSILSPISQTSTDKEVTISNTSNNSNITCLPSATPQTPVFELTEEVRTKFAFIFQQITLSVTLKLTPKRPLRSEAEKEKRISRTQSIASAVISTKIDNASVESGESSNSRHSISEFGKI